MGPAREHVRAGFRRTMNDIWTAQSTLSRTMGGHLVKAGAEFRLYRLFRRTSEQTTGEFDFSAGFTQRDPNRSDSTSGCRARVVPARYPSAGRVDIKAPERQPYQDYDMFIQAMEASSEGDAQPRAPVGLQAPALK